MTYDKSKPIGPDNYDEKTARSAEKLTAAINAKPRKFEPWELEIIKRMDEDPGATKTLKDGVLVDDPSFNKKKKQK